MKDKWANKKGILRHFAVTKWNPCRRSVKLVKYERIGGQPLLAGEIISARRPVRGQGVEPRLEFGPRNLPSGTNC